MSVKCHPVIIMLTLLFASAEQPVLADPPAPGNILTAVSLQGTNYIFEFTPDGQQVQALPIGRTPDGDDTPRGIAVDPWSNIHLYNGTFHPYLSTYDTYYDFWDHHTFGGWSTANNVSYGGLAAYANYVFATDMFTYNGGEPNGIVRFDTTDWTAQRFADGIDFINLTLGLDGLLYGLYPGGSPEGVLINVYDPDTLELVDQFPTPVSLRGIAVNANSLLFGIDWNGTLYSFDSAGNVYATLVTQTIHFGGTDIVVTPDGAVVASSALGDVFISDESLSDFTSFHVNGFTGFITVVPYPD
jgi:hypothetical protein